MTSLLNGEHINLHVIDTVFGTIRENNQNWHPILKAAIGAESLMINFCHNKENAIRQSVCNSFSQIFSTKNQAQANEIASITGQAEFADLELMNRSLIKAQFFGSYLVDDKSVNRHTSSESSHLERILKELNESSVLPKLHLDKEFEKLKEMVIKKNDYESMLGTLVGAASVVPETIKESTEHPGYLLADRRDKAAREANGEAGSIYLDPKEFGKEHLLKSLEGVVELFGDMDYAKYIKKGKVEQEGYFISLGLNKYSALKEALTDVINGSIPVLEKEKLKVYGDDFPDFTEMKKLTKKGIEAPTSNLLPRGENVTLADQINKALSIISYEHIPSMTANKDNTQPLKDVMSVIGLIQERKGSFGNYFGEVDGPTTIKVEINDETRTIAFDYHSIHKAIDSATKAAELYGDRKLKDDFTELMQRMKRDISQSLETSSNYISIYNLVEVHEDKDMVNLFDVSRKTNNSYEIKINNEALNFELAQEKGERQVHIPVGKVTNQFEIEMELAHAKSEMKDKLSELEALQQTNNSPNSLFGPDNNRAGLSLTERSSLAPTLETKSSLLNTKVKAPMIQGKEKIPVTALDVTTGRAKRLTELRKVLGATPYSSEMKLSSSSDTLTIENPPEHLRITLEGMCPPKQGLEESLRSLNEKVNGGFKLNNENPKQKPDKTYDLILVNPMPIRPTEKDTFYRELINAMQEEYPGIKAKSFQQKDFKIEGAPADLLDRIKDTLSASRGLDKK